MKSLATFSVVLFAAHSLVTSSPAKIGLTKSRPASGPTTVPASSAGILYTASVGVGSPPTHFILGIDTSTSNTWTGARQPYVKTSTTISTGQTVNVSYGVAGVSGVEYLDQLTLASNLVITNQSLGDGLSTTNFQQYNVDGLLGLGPIDLTQGTLSPNKGATIPTVMNNLASQKLVKSQVVGIYLTPSTSGSEQDGYLTFGGTDSSLYVGDVTYVPVTSTSPASKYWGFNITSLRYGNLNIIPESTAGIIASASLLLLAEEFFSAYTSQIPGAVYNQSTMLLDIPASSISSMKPLDFAIGGRTFTLDVEAQLLPASGGAGGQPGTRNGVIGNYGAFGGRGMGFALGVAFMERFYTVLDADAQRIGFAETQYTFS